MNMRVLKWMFGRVDGTADGQETLLGYMPEYHDIDWKGLEFTKEQFKNVMNIDSEKWKNEMQSHKKFFLTLERSLPNEFLRIQENNYNKLLKTPELHA